MPLFFDAFFAEYQDKIALTSPLPTDLVDAVIEVVEQDPALAATAKQYLENAQAVKAFAIPGLTEVSVLIAAMFLLGTDIKFHRTEDGKWEFLLEHHAAGSAVLEKILQAFSDLFK